MPNVIIFTFVYSIFLISLVEKLVHSLLCIPGTLVKGPIFRFYLVPLVFMSIILYINDIVMFIEIRNYDASGFGIF